MGQCLRTIYGCLFIENKVLKLPSCLADCKCDATESIMDYFSKIQNKRCCVMHSKTKQEIETIASI